LYAQIKVEPLRRLLHSIAEAIFDRRPLAYGFAPDLNAGFEEQ
jgi:hypothetical protein